MSVVIKVFFFIVEKCAVKDLTSDFDDDLLPPEVDKYKKASQSVKTALRGVEFIAQHIKDADKDNEVRKQKIYGIFV